MTAFRTAFPGVDWNQFPHVDHLQYSSEKSFIVVRAEDERVLHIFSQNILRHLTRVAKLPGAGYTSAVVTRYSIQDDNNWHMFWVKDLLTQDEAKAYDILEGAYRNAYGTECPIGWVRDLPGGSYREKLKELETKMKDAQK